MHAGVDAGKDGPEGDPVLDVMDIGPAADGNALTGQARDIRIGGKQCLHEIGVRRNDVGRNHAGRGPGEAGRFDGSRRPVFAVFLCGGNRSPGVKGEFHMCGIDMIEVQGAGQVVGFFVMKLDADAGSVGHPVGEEVRNLLHELQLLRLVQGQAGKQDDCGKACVAAAFRR